MNKSLRKAVIAGNWKMNKTPTEAKELIAAIAPVSYTHLTTAGSGKVGLLAYTADDSFTMDYYTGFYLSVRGAKDMNSFGSAYEDAVAAVTDQLETLGKDRSAIRYEQIVDDANAELDDAKEEYAEKKAEADQKLADAKQELDDGAQEIADGEKELKDAQSAIDNGQAELDSNRASYNTQIASARQQLNDGYAQIQNYQDVYKRQPNIS